ncbi:Protein CBG26040 [Caenorhabditis briggsae]|uniref:Protein CBG26040 n=1 Tax=Caenorhabditis briggsae TaxID=6238 RepID=B6IHD1_CAEBR|nr:Protein CBG26040 [Caenorhabditis briggsae]CAR99311.1 Protein CBG26040 [Caenorhabditis briggsae]
MLGHLLDEVVDSIDKNSNSDSVSIWDTPGYIECFMRLNPTEQNMPDLIETVWESVEVYKNEYVLWMERDVKRRVRGEGYWSGEWGGY